MAPDAPLRGGRGGLRGRLGPVPLRPRPGGDQALPRVQRPGVLRQALQRLQLPRPGRAAELGVPGGERVGAQRRAGRGRRGRRA